MEITEMEREIIKSFAYGYSVDQIADTYEISKSDAESYKTKFSKDIEEETQYLKEQGWM